jgi:rSAM/selenodomain-associated transferase 1
MPQTGSEVRILIFAKAPQPGAVKTRLIPALGAQGAATLHAQLVEHTLAMVCAAGTGRVELHCAPNTSNPFFRFCSAKYGIALAAQSDGDLGERMFDAFSEALNTTSHVILVGTDCPALTVSYLIEALEALRDGSDAVFVPAEDGGYALIGLGKCDARLFEGISWGGSQVMAQTRGRLRELRWRWRELDPLWDVDRPADYQRLLQSGLLPAVRAHV